MDAGGLVGIYRNVVWRRVSYAPGGPDCAISNERTRLAVITMQYSKYAQMSWYREIGEYRSSRPRIFCLNFGQIFLMTPGIFSRGQWHRPKFENICRNHQHVGA